MLSFLYLLYISAWCKPRLKRLLRSLRELNRMGHGEICLSRTENSLTSSSYKQPQQQQNKTSDRPHGSRDWFVASWRTAEPATRLQDTLCSEAQRRGSLGRVVVGVHKPWQSRAVAPFTVVVISEINGDTVMRTSEGSRIVAVECFTWVFLSYETETLSRAFVSHFPRVWGSIAVIHQEVFV